VTLLGGPLAVLNAHQASNRAHLHQLVADVARELDITPEDSSTYQKHIENILQLSTAAAPTAPASSSRRSPGDDSFQSVDGEQGWMAG
jgi:hypothetical protein